MLVHAPAKLNLCLYLGPPPRRRPARALLAVRAAGAGRPDRGRRGRARRGRLPRGRGREPRRAGAGGAARARLGAAAAAGRDREADPGRRRARRRQRRRRRGPAPRRRRGRPTSPELAAELGADVPSQLRPGAGAGPGAGERVEPLPAPAPHAARAAARRRRALHRRGLRRGRPARARPRRRPSWRSSPTRLRAAAGAGASPLAYPELLVNDLEPAARSLRPEIGDALDALREAGAPLALLSGSGPTAFGLFADLAAARAAAATLGRDDAIVCEAGRAP